MITMKIIGLINGQPSKHDGRWVAHYDPSQCEVTNRIVLETTDDIAQAKGFDTASEAMEYWRWQVGIRSDGKPNRPLTAWTIELSKQEEAS